MQGLAMVLPGAGEHAKVFPCPSAADHPTIRFSPPANCVGSRSHWDRTKRQVPASDHVGKDHAMKLNSMFAGGALALALTVSAQAQTLVTGADTAEILNAARGYGAATLTTQSNGDPQITGKIDGVTYQVYFRNCTDGADCEDLNFYLGFLDIKPTPRGHQRLELQQALQPRLSRPGPGRLRRDGPRPGKGRDRRISRFPVRPLGHGRRPVCRACRL